MVGEAGNPESLVAGPAPVNSKGRKGMDRKELIRLLLEVVQGVRGYALAGRGDLVLAPSKTNPAVRRWQKVEWGWKADREGDVRSGFIPELGHTLNVAHLLHKLHKRGYISEKALEAVMPDLIHRFENLPEEKKKKLREDPRYKEFFQYYDAYREKRTPKLLKAVDKLVHGKKPWESPKENRGFSLSDGTTEPLVYWRGTMERKEAIRLLLEAVREVRSYALAEKEGLVLAPSKTNPAVRRWQRVEGGEKGGGLKGALKKGVKVGLGVAAALALLHLAGKAGTKAALAQAMKAIEGLPPEEREKLSKDPRFQKVFEFYEAAKEDAQSKKYDPQYRLLEKLGGHLANEMGKEAEEHWKAFQKNRGFASGPTSAEERFLQAMERYRGYVLGEGLVLAPSKKNPMVRRWQRLTKDMVESWEEEDRELAKYGPEEVAKRRARKVLEALKDLHQRTKHPREREVLEHLIKHTEKLAEYGPEELTKREAKQAAEELRGLYHGAKHPKMRAAIEALVKHVEELAEMGPEEIVKRDAQRDLEKIRDLHRRTKHPMKKEALERLMKHVEELAELGPGGVARKDAQERLKTYQEVKRHLE